MNPTPYYLGCPIWACPQWTGQLFTRHAKREDWLRQYSQAFHTVEGNSTFYGLPSHQTVRRWADSVDDRFRFVLKFPRTISHDRRLVDADIETVEFLGILETLKDAGRLGPSFLQLPRGFAPAQLEDLATFLGELPRDFPYAVEVRHRDFFDNGRNETALNHLLAELRIDRVILDSRPLFSDPPTDDHERESQAQKPRCPVHETVTGHRPMIRLVGRNDIERVVPWIREWAPVVAGWIRSGLTPYVFTHAPNALHAPTLARMFHDELRKHTQRVPELGPWPGEVEGKPAKQLALF